MKNIYLKLPILALILISIGCQTEDLKTSEVEDTARTSEQIITINDVNVTVNNGMLSFPTREDYDSTIEMLSSKSEEEYDAFEKELGYVSMRSSLGIEELNKNEFYEPLLPTILNPSSMVEIAGRIFTINLTSEKVTVIPSSEFGNELSSKSKRVFNTNEDVLDILDGTESTSESARRYCRSQRKYGSISAGGSRTQYVLEYRRAGILNTLAAIIYSKYNLTVGGTSQGNSFYKNKRTCIVEDNWKSRGLRGYQLIKIYDSSRRLKAYNLDVELFAINTSTNPISLAEVDVRMTCGSQSLAGCRR